MDLVRALRLEEASPTSHPRVIAFVGAGGKTTAMFQLARQMSRKDSSPVILAASAHLGAWQLPLTDRHVILTDVNQLPEQPEPGLTLFTGPIESDRTVPLSPPLLEALHEYCSLQGRPMLIEADGARQKPLKAPAEHEPPIPQFADMVVVLAGLSALNQPLSSFTVHRPEIFSALTSLSAGELISPAALIRLLIHPQGGLKNMPPKARGVVLLNHVIGSELQAIAGRMATSLMVAYEAVLVGSLEDDSFQCFEPAAGIILAAGASTRLGKPKQLLDWHGQPFVRAVSRTALAAGLSPVLVITGAYAAQVEKVIKDLPVQIVHNPAWQEGQASSIRAGLQALQDGPFHPVGSAVFLLVDQPHLNVSILQALIGAHTLSLPPIIAPLVREERGNPVLFDKVTFPDLLALQGETGGRGIFHKYRLQYLPWHDERLLVDIDTPEQYERLVKDESI